MKRGKRGQRREDRKKIKTSDSHCDKRKNKGGKNGRHHIRIRPLRHMVSTYLLHGHMKRPQHFPKSFKFFSASFMSWLIWFMPSSTRSSCSGQDKGMTAVEWILLAVLFSGEMNTIKLDVADLEGTACIRVDLLTAKWYLQWKTFHITRHLKDI